MENSAATYKKDQMFSGAQYLLADSGFAPKSTVMPCFKKPAHSQLTDDQRRFNLQLSKLRIRNEHCIGMLKGRFQSLKGLRLRLRHGHDGVRIVAWIQACAILHNLLLTSNKDDEDWVPLEEEHNDIFDNGNENNLYINVRGDSAGKRKRVRVMEELFTFLDAEQDDSDVC